MACLYPEVVLVLLLYELLQLTLEFYEKKARWLLPAEITNWEVWQLQLFIFEPASEEGGWLLFRELEKVGGCHAGGGGGGGGGVDVRGWRRWGGGGGGGLEKVGWLQGAGEGGVVTRRANFSSPLHGNHPPSRVPSSLWCYH